MMSHKLSLAAGIAAAVFAFSSPGAQADNSQQQKMKSCNADAAAKNLTGDDRKAFMKTCLSATPPPSPTGNSQQAKMKSCNADATASGLKGDDRKTFMSSCLKGSGTSAPATTPAPTGTAPASK